MPLVVLASVLVAIAGVVWLAIGSSTARRLRAYDDPRLVTRVEGLARAMTLRGWTLLPQADAPRTVRRLGRGEVRALTIGCVPGHDWCRVELVRACGLAPGDVVAPPPFDRDGVQQAPADVPQAGGQGFVVRPLEARGRVPGPLLALLAAWPSGWSLEIVGDEVSVHARAQGSAEIEAIVADVLARFDAACP